MTYKKKIAEYCEANGIAVPAGFGRSSASRYAVILAGEPRKLVARTWFNQEDVVYYLARIATEPVAEILDFKDRQRLHYEGGKRLTRGESF